MQVLQVNIAGGLNNLNTEFDINLNRILYTMKIVYRPLLSIWLLSVKRGETSLFNSVRLVRGANLLEAYAQNYIIARNQGQLFGKLYMVGNEPTLENLGNSSRLIWVSP